ncbi:uncharacterized protein LOC119101259 [Pollicipes pollicipes]|uniref:uncharacterized protein LOC119101259 n=1 Tax=Pollicipes pollicipes TaxID=41117 RepID=UPI001885672F|nr:uncharacterized protein LOC119101259 [Pollicipes pollicipes]
MFLRAAMETVTVGLFGAAGPPAGAASRPSTGPANMDHLLDSCAPAVEKRRLDAPSRRPIDEWIPKTVVVVNLADFYKPRDASQLFGSQPEGGATGDEAASGLHLLASTANMAGGSGAEPAGKPRFTCALCHAGCSSQMALRVHSASAHATRLAVCTRCGQSFLNQRQLDRHPCEEQKREERERPRPRVPPLVVRPPKAPRVRRLEDTSSSEEEDSEEERGRSPSPPLPPPPLPRPVARRPPLPAPPAPPRRPTNGKKEAYVCRVCHSKFRDPKSVLSHLKEFHPEHARKAWNKFQENLRSRQPGSGARPAPGGAGGDDTFAVRSVAPMKLKLSRPQQQQQRLDSEPPSPGFVTCGVCGGTKYYTHTARCRLHGSYACDACRQFAGRVQPAQPIQCLLGLGRCHIPVLAPRHAADTRCRACWLKKCLAAFNMPAERHDRTRDASPTALCLR